MLCIHGIFFAQYSTDCVTEHSMCTGHKYSWLHAIPLITKLLDYLHSSGDDLILYGAVCKAQKDLLVLLGSDPSKRNLVGDRQ